jgi:AcrR family transcriptional regulator
VADAEGLDTVSMARVAKELGFTTMSLYRYVTGKDELLQLMWNASAQGAEGLVVEGVDWREKLRMWATVQREMMDRHPWITQMPMAAPPLAPNSLTFVERGLETLDRRDGHRRSRQAPDHRAHQLVRNHSPPRQAAA